MKISYHYALTKIQKLQNFKKKKKKIVLVGTPGTDRYCPIWLVFKPVRNVDVSIPVYIPVRYILAGTAGTGTVLSLLTTLVKTRFTDNELYFIGP